MRNPRVLIAAALLFLAIILSFTVLRAPRPEIVIEPETVLTIAGFEVTNSYITSWVVVIFIAVVAFLATRNLQLVPRGLQNVVEGALEAFYNLTKGVAGEANARRFFPVAATIFFYIALSNWGGMLPVFNSIGVREDPVAEIEEKIEREGPQAEATHAGEKISLVVFKGGRLVSFNFSGLQLSPNSFQVEVPQGATLAQERELVEEQLNKRGLEPDDVGIFVPLFRSVNTDINVPLAMSLVSFFFVQYWGISTLGLRGYASKFVRVGALLKGRFFDGLTDAFVGFLEALSELIRIVSLAFRLFGNTLAGEVLLVMVLFLVPLGVVQFVYGLELLFAVIQAFIFAILTVAFGALAVTGHGGGGHGGEEKGER